MEKEKGDWGFKASKKLVKLYLKQDNKSKVADKFQQFVSIERKMNLEQTSDI